MSKVRALLLMKLIEFKNELLIFFQFRKAQVRLKIDPLFCCLNYHFGLRILFWVQAKYNQYYSPMEKKVYLCRPGTNVMIVDFFSPEYWENMWRF
jgi:hypothetical protein